MKVNLYGLFGALIVLLLVLTTQAHAGYCIVPDKKSNVVTPCPDGAAQIVDRAGEKVIVCVKGDDGIKHCQVLPFKDSK
jgi:hypothetical protein